MLPHLAGGPRGLGYADGIGSRARFNRPTGLWGVNGNVFVAESGTRRVRKVVAATGEVSTVAALTQPCGVIDSNVLVTALSLWADTTHVYVGDNCVHVIYKIAVDTGQVTILAQFFYPILLWGDDSYLYVRDITWYLSAGKSSECFFDPSANLRLPAISSISSAMTTR